MQIQTIFTPAEIALLRPETNADSVCVVFDILRATTSIVTAITHGVQAVIPVSTIEQALALREQNPDFLLGGERGGDPIPGFDLGNSPAEYTQHAGKTIVMTTTNGTIALQACRGADRIYVASLLNLSATARHIRHSGATQIRLICAGTHDTFALEDGIAAGLFLAHFPNSTTCDASVAMHRMAASFNERWKEGIISSRNGEALKNAGRFADIRWALQLNKMPVVVVCESGTCRRAD